MVRACLIAAALLLFAAAGTASAHGPRQHGSDTGHLPPTSKNVQLVSSLELLGQGPVLDDQIGDLTVHKGFAYVLSGWECQPGKGGFYVADLRNPANPAEGSFVPALPNTHHPEGAQAISIDTNGFQGELLAVSNESCSAGGAGGFDLFDVSNPASPVPLVRGFGDTGVEGTLTGPATKAHNARSISVWDAGDKAYAAVADGQELHDLDIFDITDPESPQPVREYHVQNLFPAAFSDNANVGFSSHRSTTVRRIGGRLKLLVAYGDAGYIQFDAEDPADLQYEGDSDFGGTDPLTGFNPPEGNAEYAEFSFDDRYLVTAEDDVAPTRVERISIDSVGVRDAALVQGGAAPDLLPDGRMNGPAAYVGYACDESAPVPTPAEVGMPAKDPGEEWIAVVQRGPAFDPDEDYDGDTNFNNDSDDACFPGEKAGNADDAGWDAVLVVNRHTEQGAAGDGVSCGSGAFPPGSQIVTVCTTHAAFHELFDDAVTYGTPYDDSDVPPAGDDPLPAEGPDIGDQAPNKLSAEAEFDGWGYMSLYSTTPDGNGKFPLADAHAIKEALNPAFASGFGELSIREQAADPTEPLTYASWRSGGLRVMSFETGKITEQGAFIAQDGNDLWGIEQFTSGEGERLIVGSDRDFGLYVFRYTGPLAARRPACSDTSASVPSRGSVALSLACTDANGNALTRRIASGPASGTLGPIDQSAGTVTYTNTGGAGGTDSFRFEASDGAASSAPATATVSIGPDLPGPDRTAPRILSLRVRGNLIRYSLSEPATVRGTIARELPGRRVGRRCRALSPRNRRGRPCKRYQALRGSLRHRGRLGANSFGFNGRLAGRRLRAGRYLLVMRATDAAGNRSAPRRAGFRRRR